MQRNIFLSTLLLMWTILVSANAQWTVAITATSANIAVIPQTRTFGVASGATGGFDTGLDVSAPPPPPAPVQLDTYFPLSGNPFITRLSTDKRGLADAINWTYKLRADVSGGILSWDVSTVPVGTDLKLTKPDGTKVNMNALTSIPFVSVSGVEQEYTITAVTGTGTITLINQSPLLTWNYQLTHDSGAIILWSYTGTAITGASVEGAAAAGGWSVLSQTATQVVFCTTTPLTTGSLTGFHITGTAGGTGSWTVGSNSGSVDGPLPVELSLFTATRTSDGILIRWRTESETNNLGFDVYRIEGEKVVKVNPQIIKGHGTTGTPHEYQLLDPKAPEGVIVKYFIEDIDLAGKRERSPVILALSPHGVRRVTWGSIKARR
ncbi:hypothetical protein HYR99_24965 [Candidatus Poribacteria bacterium]|nr:hypothetical protein [Candidatus Poribacteria bacterium]